MAPRSPAPGGADRGLLRRRAGRGDPPRPVAGRGPRARAAAASYALVVLENERLVADLRALARGSRRVARARRGRRRPRAPAHRARPPRRRAAAARRPSRSARAPGPAPGGRCRASPRHLRELGGRSRRRSTRCAVRARRLPPLLTEQRAGARRCAAPAGARPCRPASSASDVVAASPEIETTVYFACVEALQNVAKHAAARPAIVDRAQGETGACASRSATTAPAS